MRWAESRRQAVAVYTTKLIPLCGLLSADGENARMNNEEINTIRGGCLLLKMNLSLLSQVLHRYSTVSNSSTNATVA